MCERSEHCFLLRSSKATSASSAKYRWRTKTSSSHILSSTVSRAPTCSASSAARHWLPCLNSSCTVDTTSRRPRLRSTPAASASRALTPRKTSSPGSGHHHPPPRIVTLKTTTSASRATTMKALRLLSSSAALAEWSLTATSCLRSIHSNTDAPTSASSARSRLEQSMRSSYMLQLMCSTRAMSMSAKSVWAPLTLLPNFSCISSSTHSRANKRWAATYVTGHSHRPQRFRSTCSTTAWQTESMCVHSVHSGSSSAPNSRTTGSPSTIMAHQTTLPNRDLLNFHAPNATRSSATMPISRLIEGRTRSMGMPPQSLSALCVRHSVAVFGHSRNTSCQRIQSLRLTRHHSSVQSATDSFLRWAVFRDTCASIIQVSSHPVVSLPLWLCSNLTSKLLCPIIVMHKISIDSCSFLMVPFR